MGTATRVYARGRLAGLRSGYNDRAFTILNSGLGSRSFRLLDNDYVCWNLSGHSSAFALAPGTTSQALPETRTSCWFRNDHDGAIHKARRRTGDDLIRFRETLGDFQFRPKIAINRNFADLDCAIRTDYANSGFS